ncbi:MAG: FhaA domain-containing protein [Coriobacteriales bacterium]|jgi:hypothetical protein
MGFFSRFENKAEDVIEGSGGSGRGGIEPVKLAKRACKEMEREKMVGVGNEYAPTLYNILLSPADDEKMSGYYPSLAGEIETYLTSHAERTGLVFDCPPLVRFIVDEGLKRGRFDIIAESVSPAIIRELRHEEMVHYGLEKEVPEEAQYQQPVYKEPVYQEPAAPAEPAYEPEDLYQQPYQEPQAYGEPQPYEDQYYQQPQTYQPDSSYQQPQQPSSKPPENHASVAGSAYVAGAAANVARQAANAKRVYPPTNAPVESAYEPRAYHPQGYEEPSSAASADATVMINEAPIPEPPHAALYNYGTQDRYQIYAERSTIGRETTCNVVIPDPSVSRHHAEILHNDNGWLIRDTGSTNGTSVNGTPTTQSRIYNGDIISLGNTQLEFQEG